MESSELTEKLLFYWFFSLLASKAVKNALKDKSELFFRTGKIGEKWCIPFIITKKGEKMVLEKKIKKENWSSGKA